MQKLILCIFALIVTSVVLSDNIKAAEAGTISGTAKIDGVGTSAVKITAESVNTDPAIGYQVTTSGTGGTWSMTVTNGQTYSVDGMKSTATHGRVSNVNGNGQSGVNHNLVSRPTPLPDVVFKIAADEEFRTQYGTSWQSTAINKLNMAEPWFLTEHGIDFVVISATNFYAWSSNNNALGCGGPNPPDPTNYLHPEVRSESGWNSGTYNGADILIAFTRQSISDADGCANVPGSGGTHPAIVVQDAPSSGDLTRVIMHEITHTYGFNHDSSCNFEPSIMLTPNNLLCSNFIKNWRPAHDDTLETRRSWY
ncbi:MAG: hypothetical protein HZA84_04110 [Thaumarchaeota archaeon]|nr:hypothetical protein [Nitrososphaerota archaeon]